MIKMEVKTIATPADLVNIHCQRRRLRRRRAAEGVFLTVRLSRLYIP